MIKAIESIKDIEVKEPKQTLVMFDIGQTLLGPCSHMIGTSEERERAKRSS